MATWPRRIIIFIALIVTVSGCSESVEQPATITAAPAPIQGSTSVEDNYFPDLGNGGYQVENYNLDIEILNVFESNLDATVTIDAVATKYLESFSLDFVGFEISEVGVDGISASFIRDGHELIISPLTPIEDGASFEVLVKYQGKPDFYFSRAVPVFAGWVNFFHGSFVMNGWDGAMNFYPVNNTPQDKASYKFEITVPKPYEAVANGQLVETVDQGDLTTYTWNAPDPMASYLVTIDIGKFDEFHLSASDGLPISIYYPEGVETPRFLRNQAEIIDFFSTVFGPYPFESYGTVIVDTPLNFGMEAQTMTVFGNNESDELHAAHETAHSWFGNSVTIKHAEDIWLNEGFATYAMALWAEHTDGKVGLDRAIKDFFLRTRTARGLVSPPASPDPDDLFNLGIYYRGAIALQMLRNEIGDQAFFESLQSYYASNKGGNVTTADFISVCESTSERDLSDFFQTWLYEEEMPVVEAYEPCFPDTPHFAATGDIYLDDGTGREYASYYDVGGIDHSICRDEEIDGISITCLGVANFLGALDKYEYIFAINGIGEEELPNTLLYRSNCGNGEMWQLDDNVYALRVTTLLCRCDFQFEIDENTSAESFFVIQD